MKTNMENVLMLNSDEATTAFRILCGPVPPEYTYQRDGRAGLKLTYLPHHVANRLMLQAFGPYWSWDVQEIVAHGGSENQPASVHARGTLTLYVQVGDQALPITKTAVGAFDNTMKLNGAAAAAAAASMALSKALVRCFGFGLENYESDRVQPQVDPATVAWNRLLEYAGKKGVDKKDLSNALKALGHSGSDLADPNVEQEAVTIINRLSAAEPTKEPPFTEAVLPPGLDKAKLPPVVEDPVVEAAKELGAEIVVPSGWRDFFIYETDKHTGLVSGTQIGQVLDMIFGKRPMPEENRWAEMDIALEDWMAADADADRQKQIMDKYRGTQPSHADEDEIPF